MTGTARTLLAYWAAVLAFGTAELSAQSETHAKFVDTVLSATDLEEHDEAVTTLFRTLNADQRRRLKNHAHDTVALAAAWREVRSRLSVATDPDRKPVEGVAIPDDALERFLGFVEGRLRIELPSLWEKSLTTARANSPDAIYIAHFDHWPVHKTAAGLNAPLSVQAEGGEDRLIVFWNDGESCEVPKGLLRNDWLDTGNVNVAGTGNLAFVAFYDDVGWSYDLHCIGPDPNDVKWTAKVFATYSGGTTGAGFVHRMTMRVNDGKVYVFGACLIGAYVEVFSAEDGEPLCRFTTSTRW